MGKRARMAAGSLGMEMCGGVQAIPARRPLFAWVIQAVFVEESRSETRAPRQLPSNRAGTTRHASDLSQMCALAKRIAVNYCWIPREMR